MHWNGGMQAIQGASPQTSHSAILKAESEASESKVCVPVSSVTFISTRTVRLLIRTHCRVCLQAYVFVCAGALERQSTPDADKEIPTMSNKRTDSMLFDILVIVMVNSAMKMAAMWALKTVNRRIANTTAVSAAISPIYIDAMRVHFLYL